MEILNQYEIAIDCLLYLIYVKQQFCHLLHLDEVDGRIVVLRKSDRANNLLQFHTDLRSPKVDILKKNKNASLVFYDKEEKIQLRIKVECDVNNQNSTTEESWKKTQHISRRCYLTDSPPGTAVPGGLSVK